MIRVAEALCERVVLEFCGEISEAWEVRRLKGEVIGYLLGRSCENVGELRF